MINTQGLTLYLICVDVSNVPENTLEFQDMMSDLNQRDMYPDEIQKAIFKFTETENLNKNFVRMGLEGTNFIETTGSLIITLNVIIVSIILVKLLNKLLRKCYRYSIARTIGMNIDDSETVATSLVGVYMAGYLDILVSSTKAR